jgi:Holliday junction resolvasome RuvABC ATP-dependent DNA helicase subunit
MFIGQNKLCTELDILLPLLRNGDMNINILFRAPSGYGKTTLAFIMANYIDKLGYYYYLPDSSGIVTIHTDKRVHIVDEIHTCKNQEYLYPLMDSDNYIFIFTTNETGELKEPLQNRCTNYIFEPYTDKELTQVIDTVLVNKPEFPNFHNYFLQYTRTPRVLVKLCQRLAVLFSYYGVPSNEAEFTAIFEGIINIRDGLDMEQMRYMQFLHSVNSASLDLISNAIRVDKATIKRDIEPGLIYKNLITISSKGRTVINE